MKGRSITLVVLLSALWSFTNAQWGENTELWQKVKTTSRFSADSLWIGAAFLRDETKPFEVWLTYNEAACVGALYFMVPSRQDSAFYLFQNRSNTGPTKVDLTRFNVAHMDTIYFMYKILPGVGVNDETCPEQRPRYTGPNRKAGEGWQMVDRYASEVEGTYPLKVQGYEAGRRWCVAGWVRENGMKTDTVEFGFEDVVAGDDDFDDIVFHVSGVYLIAAPNRLRLYGKSGTPDISGNLPLGAIDTVYLGSSKTIYAHVFDTTGKWEQQYDQTVQWTVMDAMGNQIGDPVTGASYTYAGDELGSVTLTAKFQNPDYPDSRPISVSHTIVVAVKGRIANIVSATTQDVNANGYLDAIRVVFDTTVTIPDDYNFSNTTLTYNGQRLQVTGMATASGGSTGTEFYVKLQEPLSGPLQTSWEPVLTIKGIPAISATPVTAKDGAGPVIQRAVYYPGMLSGSSGGNGTPDTIRVTLSEPVVWPSNPDADVSFGYFHGTSRENDVFTTMIYSEMNAVLIVKDGFTVVVDTDSLQLLSTSGVKDKAGNAPPPNGRKAPIEWSGESILFLVPSTNPFIPGQSVIPSKIQSYYSKVLESAGNNPSGVLIGIESDRPLRPQGEAYGTADIYDAVGNLVQDDLPVQLAQGRDYGIYWDGRNSNGRIVGRGTYLVKINVTDVNGKKIQKRLKIGVKR